RRGIIHLFWGFSSARSLFRRPARGNHTRLERGCHAPPPFRIPRPPDGHSGRRANAREERNAPVAGQRLESATDSGRPTGSAGGLVEQQRDPFGTTQGAGGEIVSDR